MHRITKDIGQLSGKVLIFGGAYSNLQALEALREVATSEGISPNNTICTGDVVAYCAQPEETVQTMRDWGVHCILGNVEIQLRDDKDDCGCDFSSGSRCDIFSRQWYPYAKEKLSESSLSWMKTLPDFIILKMAGRKGLVVHGSHSETAEYIFGSTPWAVKQASFDSTNTSFVLSGHSGLPFSEENDGNLWLNAGVIGMPANDGTARVWYSILNEEDGRLKHSHHAMEYDNTKAYELMTFNNLPPQYAKTLMTGIWDNCEILPEQETAKQGKAIEL